MPIADRRGLRLWTKRAAHAAAHTRPSAWCPVMTGLTNGGRPEGPAAGR